MPDEAMARWIDAVIEAARQRVQQVGAVKSIIGRAIAQRRLSPVVEFERLSGLHVAGVDSRRRLRDRGDLLAQADRLQAPVLRWG